MIITHRHTFRSAALVFGMAFAMPASELVKKGKISETEGKKLVDEFLDKADKGKKDLEKRYEALTERLGVNKSEEVELEKLKKKVSDLESKLGKEKTAKAAAKA